MHAHMYDLSVRFSICGLGIKIWFFFLLSLFLILKEQKLKRDNVVVAFYKKTCSITVVFDEVIVCVDI